jgi:flagellar hook-associated protein 3 FlgL
MRISSSLFYDRAADAMGRLSSRADALQTQIATGKRLGAASDDSAAYSRLRGIARATADSKVSAANLDTAAAVLAQADGTLTDIAAQIQRASELAIRARTGSNDATALAAIADEIDALRDQLVALGNATDSRGQPLFGGRAGEAAVTLDANGVATLAASSPSPIPTGAGQSVQPSESAQRVFAFGGTDVFAVLADLSAALRSGTDVPAEAGQAITDLGRATTQALTVQASLGARAARVELEQAALSAADIDREAARSALEDTDITAAITELQKTMTVLQATQASFTKLQGLTLFDYLR